MPGSLLFIKTTVDISLDSQNLHHHVRNRGVRDVYSKERYAVGNTGINLSTAPMSLIDDR